MPDDPMTAAALRLRAGIGELREHFRTAGRTDLIDAVLESMVGLERITSRQQAAELADRADELRARVDAARPYVPSARGWHQKAHEPTDADKLTGLGKAAVALAAMRAGIDQPKPFIEPVVAFGI